MVDLKDNLFTAAEIARAVGGTVTGNENAVCRGITTDSRKVLQDDLFVALRGENFDGDSFADSAFSKGAAICLVGRGGVVRSGRAVVQVDDTGAAFLALAGYYRSKFDVKVVGVTGSVGKTGTKDMTALALEGGFSVLKTAGNFNNTVGLPITLFGLQGFHSAAVVEMGMSGPGEISALSNAARPDIAVITNIGMSHIEKLGTMENILKAKLEILDGMTEGGCLILNGDDPRLRSIQNLPCKRIYYGLDSDCDIRGTVISDDTVEVLGERISLSVSGRHNLSNTCAAMAVAHELGVSPKKAAEGIAQFTPEGSRQKIVESGRGFTVICDYYNASPQSVEAALLLLSKKEGRKIAVLGDMLELGEYAAECHAEAGAQTAREGIDCLYTYGEHSFFAAEAAAKNGICTTEHFRDKEKLVKFLKGFLREGDVLLIKGSRGMKMEDVFKGLMER